MLQVGGCPAAPVCGTTVLTSLIPGLTVRRPAGLAAAPARC